MDLKDLINRSIENAIDETCRKIIEEKVGWGIDSEVKQAIKEEARKILNEPEMKELLKDRLIHWIQSA